MINFEILKGGGKGRGTRAHVFLNCVINLNKKTKKNRVNDGGRGNCIHFKLRVNSNKYVQK